MEQFLLTFGRIGTEYLVQLADEPPYYGSVDKHKEEQLLDAMSNDGINPASFLQEIPLEHKLWWDNVAVYKPGHQDRMDKKMKTPLREVKPTRPCTVSTANHALGDLRGKEKGRHVMCHDCGCCETEEERMKVLTRKIGSNCSLDDFKSILATSQPRYRTPVELQINQKAFMYSSTTACHYATSQILKSAPDRLEPLFHLVDKSNLSWVSNNGQRYWFFGRVLYQILWKEHPRLEDLDLKAINSKLTAFQILDVHPALPSKDKFITLNHFNLYDITLPGLSGSFIKSGFSSFDGMVEVAAKTQMDELETEPYHMEELPHLFVLDSPGGARVLVNLPLRVNPLLFLRAITGITYKSLLGTAWVRCMYTLSKTSGVCKICGQPQIESATGKMAPGLCVSCFGKFIINKIK